MTDSPGSDPRYLYTWVHLSDLHFGHGTPTHQYDQKMVLKALAEDIESCGHGAYPRPQSVIVTGDIAFSGAGRSPDEYTQAETWLDGILGAHGIARSAVFLVPGNHDVDRGVEENDSDTQSLLEKILDGENIDDNAIARPADLKKLKRRQRAYLKFAARYEPARAELWWQHTIQLGDLALRIVGINTALVASGNRDPGCLQVGNRQLADLLSAKPHAKEVVCVLTHHPTTGEWLSDHKTTDRQIRTRSHIHFSGHVHDAETCLTMSGSAAEPHVSIRAGAAHGEASEPRSFGYSVGALLEDDRGLVLRVWPRKWSEKNRDFRLDAEGVPSSGLLIADHVLKPAASVGTPRPQ